MVFALFLAFSLTTELILWDELIISQSVTFGLTALLVAAWIVLIRSPRPRWAAAVLVLTLLGAFARDTNAYLALVIAALVALALVRSRRRTLMSVLAVGLCAIFVLDYVSADAGKRWLQPMIDFVDHRVLDDSSMEHYFVAHGFDPSSNWPRGSWIQHRSRSVYGTYLLTHPRYALTAPLHGRQQTLYSSPRNVTSLVDPSFALYNNNAGHRFLPLPKRAERILFPRGVVVVGALIVLVLAGAGLIAWRAGPELVWLVPSGSS